MAGITANTTTISFDGNIPADLLSISGPSVNASTIDTTSMGSTERSFLGGNIDGGDITFDIAFDPTGGTHKALTADLLTSTNATVFDITWSDSASTTGTGILTGFSVTGSMDDKLTASATIKCSGAVTFAAS